MASGRAAPDATEFELSRVFGSPTNGSSSPFLDHAKKTLVFQIKVSVNGDGTWSYDQDTARIVGCDQLFHHTQHAAQNCRTDAQLADAPGRLAG